MANVLTNALHWQTMKTSFFAEGHLAHSRIRVVGSFGTYWHTCNELLPLITNHKIAAQEYARKQKWQGKWTMEILAEKGYIFIPIRKETCIEV